MYKWVFERQEIRSCILGACESIFHNKRLAEEVYDCIMEDVEDFLSDHQMQSIVSNLDGENAKYSLKGEPMKTADYCDICKRDMCEVCITDATNPYCVPSHYEINYEPKDEPHHSGEATEMVEQQTDDGTAFIKRHGLRVDYGDEVPYDLKPFIDW